MVVNILRRLGLNDSQFKIKYSNRKIWTSLFEKIKASKEVESKILRAVDKKDRLGDEGVKELLCEGRKDKSGDFMEGVVLDNEQASMILDFMNNQKQTSDDIDEFNSYLENFADYPISFDPSIVRGLDYYTGMIFEAELLIDVKNTKGETIVFGSVAGGGRYDNLSRQLGGKDMHAIGFAIGVERIIELLNIEKIKQPLKVGFIIAAEQIDKKTYKIADDLRSANNSIILDSFLSEGSLKSQLRRANKNNCSYAIIIGEEELKNDQVIWKDLSEGGGQELLTSKEVIDKYTNL